MDAVQTKLVLGLAGRLVYIFDSRNLKEPMQKRESSLKYQTRCIRCFPHGDGYVISSIEGRVAVDYFDPSEASQSRKYAFKCHRENQNGAEIVFPVNAICFHPM